MGLPILGLLALGGAVAGRGQIQGLMDKQDARRFERSGVDFGGTEAGDIQQQFAQAGQLGSGAAQQAIGERFDQQQADARNQTSITTAGIGAAAGMIRANLAVQQHEATVETATLRKQAFEDLGGNPLAYGTPLEATTWAMAGQDPRMYENMSPKVQQMEATKAQIAEVTQNTALEQANADAQLQGVREVAQETGLERQTIENLSVIEATPIKTAADTAFVAEAEPLLQESNSLTQALADADAFTQSPVNWGASQEGVNARARLSLTMEDIRQRRFRASGRADSMQEADQKRWAELIPEPGKLWSAKNRETVRNVLREAKETNRMALETAQARREGAKNGDPEQVLRAIEAQARQ